MYIWRAIKKKKKSLLDVNKPHIDTSFVVVVIWRTENVDYVGSHRVRGEGVGLGGGVWDGVPGVGWGWRGVGWGYSGRSGRVH